jgi:SpoIIAA-like
MIERLRDLPAGVDGLRAMGKVTKEDYDTVLLPLLEEARAQGRCIRLLYHLGPEFEGFTAGGAWEDARLGLRYLRLFERCAMVSDVGWVREASRLAAFMMPCPVKVFGNQQWQEALAWISSPATPGAALAHRLLPESGVLVIEPDRPLRAEDFDALALTVDSWIEAHGDLRGVVVHAREFPGWDNLGAFFRHLRFVRDHHRLVRRIAVAAGGRLADLAPKLAEHFIAAEIKHFDYEDLDRAIAWAGGRADR